MADTKISLETTAGTLTGTELIPAVQVGANVKFTPNALINDMEICTYNAATNAIEYPPGTPIVDLDAGGATDASQYVLMTADAALPNSRVLTSSTSNTISTAVAGQVQIQSAALTGDVTASANSNATTIANGVVTNAKMANMAANTIKANNSSISAAAADVALSTNQVLLRGAADIAAHTLRRNLRVVGTNLDSGQDLFYGFKTSTTPSNPSAGYFRLDTTDVNTVTLLRMNVTDSDSVSQATRIGLIKTGDRLFIMSTVSPFTVVSVWAVTAAPVEVVDAVNGNYYNIGVDHVAGVIPTTSLEACEIKHFPAGSLAITEAAILAAMPGAVRFSFGGVGGAIDGFFTADNTFVDFVNPSYVYASLPAVTDANDGSTVRIHQSSFGGGSTRVSRNIKATANFSTGTWEPDGGRQLLYSVHGSLATPVANMAAVVGHALTRFDLGADGNFSIPANFLKVGRGLQVIARVGKTGTSTGTSVVGTRFGKNNTTSDQLISSVTLTNTNSQQCRLDAIARVTAIGAGASSYTSDSLGTNGQAASSISDKSTAFDSTLVNYVSVGVDASTDTDTHSLYSLEVWWV